MSIHNAVDYYPTPKSIAEKMFSPYMRRVHQVLEPSAGDGNIAEVVRDFCASLYQSDQPKISCIELDEDLRGVLRSKGFNVVHDDFLTFKPETFFDLIIMNPPFSACEDHLLRAWEILRDGDVVCLLNSEIILNPFSKKRQLIRELIEAHGSVENLGTCFSAAERRTNVNVSLIRLHKESHVEDFDFLRDGTGGEEREMGFDYDAVSDGGMMNTNAIRSMVDVYDAIRAEFSDYLKHAQKLTYLFSYVLGEHIYEKSHLELAKLLTPFCSSTMDTTERRKQFMQHYNDLIEYTRLHAWEAMFSKSNLDRFMTQKVKDDFLKFQGTTKRTAFTEENIAKFFENILVNRNKILTESVLESFDLMTKYHKENRVHPEGWKTNDSWKVNRRVVLPYIVDTRYGSWSLYYGGCRGSWALLDDIDRGLCMLSGDNFERILTTEKAINESFKTTPGEAESRFFLIKYYKKGTAHLYFKDEKLWENFNITVARIRNWLPEKKSNFQEDRILERK